MIGPARRWWQLAAGLLLLNVLAAVFLLLPAREGRARQEDQLLDLQRRVRALQREGQSSESLLAGMRQVEEFARGFPPREEAVDLKARLSALARSLAVDVPSVNYTPTEMKEAGLVKLTLAMNVEGSYPKVRRYLYELEGMRRHLVIERLALRDPQGTADLQLQLQLAVYLRSQ
jgi:hypothetical protein